MVQANNTGHRSDCVDCANENPLFAADTERKRGRYRTESSGRVGSFIVIHTKATYPRDPAAHEFAAGLKTGGSACLAR
jgi:hypothetical protein